MESHSCGFGKRKPDYHQVLMVWYRRFYGVRVSCIALFIL